MIPTVHETVDRALWFPSERPGPGSGVSTPEGAGRFVLLAGVLVLVAIIAITAVVRKTFAVALYRYATTGSAEGPFEPRDLQAPFSPKRGLFR